MRPKAPRVARASVSKVRGYVGARIWYPVSEQVAVTLVPGDRPVARRERSVTDKRMSDAGEGVVDG
jgi:hypothetical protein